MQGFEFVGLSTYDRTLILGGCRASSRFCNSSNKSGC